MFPYAPQPGVPTEEAAAAVVVESYPGTWTTVWTDNLTDSDRYKGRCYDIEPVSNKNNQYFFFIAYPSDLFKKVSVTRILIFLASNTFGFKALRSLRLKDIRRPVV